MSSLFVNKLFPIGINKSDKLNAIALMPESLADYVSRMMREKDLSSYAVERYSGGAISQSHAYRIATGAVTTPSAKSLKALAKGLSVPEGELFAVARGITESAGVIADERLQTIGFRYGNMPKKKRQKADYIIDLLEREIQRIENEAD